MRWLRRVAWSSLAVYGLVVFVIYPPRRSGGQTIYLDGAPIWVIIVSVVLFLVATIFFIVMERHEIRDNDSLDSGSN